MDDANGDPFEMSGLPPARHRGRYGAYLNFQQNLTPDLKVFLNAVVADDRTSTTDRQIAAGLVYTGLFDTRPEDDIGFAMGTTHVNDRVADEEGIDGSEYAAEIYYTLPPERCAAVSPEPAICLPSRRRQRERGCVRARPEDVGHFLEQFPAKSA